MARRFTQKAAPVASTNGQTKNGNGQKKVQGRLGKDWLQHIDLPCDRHLPKHVYDVIYYCVHEWEYRYARYNASSKSEAMAMFFHSRQSLEQLPVVTKIVDRGLSQECLDEEDLDAEIEAAIAAEVDEILSQV